MLEPFSVLIESEPGSRFFVWRVFLTRTGYPLRSKTLQIRQGAGCGNLTG
jgi:hypothetical protein